MRILLVTESKGWSGGAAQALLLAEGLRVRGHQVHLACRQESEIGRRSAAAGIPQVPVRIHGDLDLLAIFHLVHAVRRLQAEVIHAQHPKAHGVCLWVKAILSLFGRPPALLVTRRVSFPVHERLFSRLKYRSRWIDRFVAVSGGIREVLIAGGVPAERIEVIYSGVDPKSFQRLSREAAADLKEKLQLNSGRPVIMKIANYASWKGQQVLLKAAALLRAEGRQFHLVLVGRETDGAEARALVQQMGLTDSAHLLGFRADVADLLSVADISVNSAIAGEGLAGSLRESLLLGVPIVASDVSGNREMAQEMVTGRLVPSDDPKALAAALAWALDHPADARRLAETGRQRVLAEFTVENMVQKTEALYQRLL